MTPVSRHLWIACLLAAAALAAHGRDVTFGYVGLDDGSHFSENPDVTGGLTRRGWVYAWTDMGAKDNNWVPLARLSHMLDFSIFGPRKWGHHLTNVLLHAANAGLLFLALRALTGAVWRSAAVGLLLAVHPVHVESVAWVSERRDVLSLFFGCISLWAYAGYARKPSIRQYAVLWLATSASVLAKPTMVTLPCVLLLLDIWPLGRLPGAMARPAGKRLNAVLLIVLEKIPLLTVAALGSEMTLRAQKDIIIPTGILLPQLRLVNALRGYGAYLYMLVWPVNLSPLYTNWNIWPLWAVAVPIALLLLISYVAVRARRSHPYLLVGWLWFLGTLVPMIGLVPVGSQVYACRYAYWTFIGLYITIAWSTTDLLARLAPPAGRARIAGALLLAVAVLGVAGTLVQSDYWNDNVKLYELALSKGEPKMLTYLLYAHSLERAGRSIEAEQACKKAAIMDPFYPPVVLPLARYALERGDLPTARNIATLVQKRLRGNQAATWLLLGNVAMASKDPAEALRCYQHAAAMEPQAAMLRFKTGQAFDALGRPDDALDQFILAVSINRPEPVYNRALGMALMKQNRYEEAAPFLRLAATTPESTIEGMKITLQERIDAWKALEKALEESGRHEDALDARRHAEALETSAPAPTRKSQP